MGFSLVLGTLLCFTTWMTSVHTTHGPVKNCCMRWSNTRVKLEYILNYTIQPEGVCHTAAIVFLTKSGKRICSDPNSNWAQRAKSKVDEEMEALPEKGENEEGSTSFTTTPAVSTTSIKAQQKTGRNGKRRQRKGSKGQRKCV